MKRLLAPLALLAVCAAPPGEARTQHPDLKAEIDGSLRWLRGVQDPVHGSYGTGIDGTAWALRAFAESPRRYRRSDGPFVARALDWLASQQHEDGSIHVASAKGAAIAEETALAAAALTFYRDPETKSVLGRALEYVGREGVTSSGGTFSAWEKVPEFPSVTEALAFSREALATRNEDGSWDGESGKVIATAWRVVALSRAHTALAPSPEPGTAKAEPLPAFAAADAARVDASILRGARFLMTTSQAGRFGAPGEPDAGLTAMAVAALQTVSPPRPEDIQAAIDGGLAWLVSLQHDDGSIHDGKLANYVTSAAILALARSGDPELEDAIVRARDFLVALQADEDEHYSPDHPFYGGIGYGGDERPDLSNLQMAVEALAASGLEKDHPAFQRALTFLQRCQNRSETNDVAIVEGVVTTKSGEDGGAAYAPGNSPAGYVELDDGVRVARSYGSMTYALLKSYALAGLPKEDPRMQAAWTWLREHYTLDVNPGFEAADDPRAAYQGLYYYFLTMAQALDLYGDESVVDVNGVEHPWRKEVAGRVIAMQKKTDGSWINENSPRWWEGNPLLATAYALLTLDRARPR